MLHWTIYRWDECRGNMAVRACNVFYTLYYTNNAFRRASRVYRRPNEV